MKSYLNPLTLLGAVALVFGLSACSEGQTSSDSVNNEVTQQTNHERVKLDVYKSPTCGCCADWVDHIETAGFETLVHHPSDLASIKQANGIGPDLQSCHTAITNEGYVFEGHIPAHIMQRFLDNPPEGAIGLAVPGMPIGSPGMEMGDRYDNYAVMLVMEDGSSKVYEQVTGQAHHE